MNENMLDEAYEIIDDNYEMIANTDQKEAERVDSWMEKVRQGGFVVLSKQKYDSLLYIELHMEYLEARGVSNWSGWGLPPDPTDYESQEEFEEAYEKSLKDIYSV